MRVERARFFRRNLVWIIPLILLHVVILLAASIAPYDPTAQNRDLPYAPPTLLHFVDSSGFHLRPFVYAWVTRDDANDSTAGDPDHEARYKEDRTRAYPLRVFTRGDSYSFLGLFETNLHLFGVDDPGKVLLLGTDEFGRDEFSRVLVGGQISIAAGLLATAVTLLIGSIVGLVAGYYGGWIDETLMGTSELFLSLPWLYFLLGVRAFLPLHLSPARTFLLLVCVIGLIGWASPARILRGVVLSSRTRNYVLAARGFGASNFYILRRHILPDTSSVLLTQAALLIPRYIAAEVALSFFGLGVNEPTPSWGNMLAALQQYSVLVSYGWMLAPAAALFITSVMYYLLADALHSRVESRQA
jgi:peptide/nickel transport system permease protein